METVYIRHPISASVTAQMRPCVLALGFFDGVHLGHKEVLEAAKAAAKQKQLSFGVMTFYPHPKDIIQANEEPRKYLTPLPIKEERFREMGVEKLFVVRFTPEFARLRPKDFVVQYIVGLRCKHVVAGFDYHYGYKGKGTMATLKKEGDGKFQVTVIHPIKREQEKISSTAIRNLLAVGNVALIPSYLGDFYEIRGKVKKASIYYKNNQFLHILVDEEYMLPTPGIYKVYVEIDGQRYKGTCQQISSNGNQSFLLVQLTNCLINTYEKRVKVKWLQFSLRKAKEDHDIYQYMEGERRII
ncbi:cytidyltransferase [Anoxybacillus rupiensis]|uniref:Riboflavin biosynthesis protein n=1 Tax=Anoxybacteroides rupiense TaxID=311460 RepID=A0ABD5IUX0_9BACL|nr:cytidyltransferase [Anoxybacillus rupiensis]